MTPVTDRPTPSWMPTPQQVDAIGRFVRGVLGPNAHVIIFNPHKDNKADLLIKVVETIDKEFSVIPQPSKETL